MKCNLRVEYEGIEIAQSWFSTSFYSHQFNSIQSLSHVQPFSTHGLQQARLLCSSPTPGACSNSCPSSQWCHPIILSSVILFFSEVLLPSVLPSIKVFSKESVLRIRWPKYWSFSFSISLSNEYSGLISFRMDWLDLLAVQGTLKSLLQHHSSKASILQYFIVQLSHPYTTTGKTIALTRQNFVNKVISLLFNMLSRLVIAFPPRSKHLLISWLQSTSAVILEPKKIICHCFQCFCIDLPFLFLSPSYVHSLSEMHSPIEIQLLRWPSHYTFYKLISFLNYHWFGSDHEEENKIMQYFTYYIHTWADK